MLVLLSLFACGPSPASIQLSGMPDTVLEGGTADLTATVLDGEGSVIEGIEVGWSFEPADAATREGGTITFAKEGDVVVRLSAGDLAETHTVSVGSPLLGSWERDTQPFKGMIFEIKAIGPKLMAEITTPPPVDEESTKWRAEIFFADVLAPMAMKLKYAEAYGLCYQEAFAEGLMKMKEFERLDDNMWEARSMAYGHVEGAILEPGKPCPEVSNTHNPMMVELTAEGKLQLKNPEKKDEEAGTSQTWSRVEG